MQEKELTRALDALAAERRRLPMVGLDADKYQFTAPDGSTASRLRFLHASGRTEPMSEIILERGYLPTGMEIGSRYWLQLELGAGGMREYADC